MREFPHFHGNGLEFSNSIFAVTPSGPYRLCMCDLVQFGPKAREEMYVKHFYVTGFRLYCVMSQVFDYIELDETSSDAYCKMVLNASAWSCSGLSASKLQLLPIQI